MSSELYYSEKALTNKIKNTIILKIIWKGASHTFVIFHKRPNRYSLEWFLTFCFAEFTKSQQSVFL